MKKSPLQTVKDTFGSREKLVDELLASADALQGDASKDETKSRLMGLSNAKLLRLMRTEQTVRERFGDRAKLGPELLPDLAEDLLLHGLARLHGGLHLSLDLVEEHGKGSYCGAGRGGRLSRADGG